MLDEGVFALKIKDTNTYPLIVLIVVSARTLYKPSFWVKSKFEHGSSTSSMASQFTTRVSMKGRIFNNSSKVVSNVNKIGSM